MKIDEINYELVTPNMLFELASDFGWKLDKDFENGRSVWFNDERDSALWIPTQKQFSDYQNAVNRIIKNIAKDLKVDVSQVIENLTLKYSDKDLIEFRFVAPDTEDGNIPMGDGTSVFYAIQSLFNNSVKAAKNVSQNVKDIFIANSQYSQTKYGSYVVTLYTPTLKEESENNNALPNMQKSVGREINKRLFSRLKYLHKTINSQKSVNITLTLNGLFEEGFTKSEFEAIEKLFGSRGHREWEVSAKWSGTNQDLDENSKSDSVLFSLSDYEPIHEIVEKLKIIEEQAIEVTLYGQIEGSKRGYEEEIGNASLKATYKGKSISIRLNLTDELYVLAQKANSNKYDVRVLGKLTEMTVGRYKKYYMEDVYELNYANDELPL
jgi:hypothetical protein